MQKIARLLDSKLGWTPKNETKAQARERYRLYEEGLTMQDKVRLREELRAVQLRNRLSDIDGTPSDQSDHDFELIPPSWRLCSADKIDDMLDSATDEDHFEKLKGYDHEPVKIVAKPGCLGFEVSNPSPSRRPPGKGISTSVQHASLNRLPSLGGSRGSSM